MNLTRTFAFLLSSAVAARGQVFLSTGSIRGQVFGSTDPDPKLTQECVSAGSYETTLWADMPVVAQEAATVLGYSQGIWDLGGYSILQSADWAELTDDQRAASEVLGCNANCWDHCD